MVGIKSTEQKIEWGIWYFKLNIIILELSFRNYQTGLLLALQLMRQL